MYGQGIGSGLWLGLVGLGLGLGNQASRVYLPRMAIHSATGEASHMCIASADCNCTM